MALDIVATKATTNTDTTITVELPSAYSVGDKLFVMLSLPNANNVTSSWTTEASIASSTNTKLWLFSKTAVANEPDPIFTTTVSVAMDAIAFVVTGQDPTTHIDVTIVTSDGGSSATMTYPSITPTSADTLIVQMGASNAGTGTTTDYSFTRQRVVTRSNRYLTLNWYGHAPSNSATGPASETLSASARLVTMTVAIRGASANGCPAVATEGITNIKKCTSTDTFPTPVDINTIRSSFTMNGVTANTTPLNSVGIAQTVGMATTLQHSRIQMVTSAVADLYVGFYSALVCDLSGTVTFSYYTENFTTSTADYTRAGLYLEDGAGAWVVKALPVRNDTPTTFWGSINNLTTLDSSGSTNLANIARVGYVFRKRGGTSNTRNIHFSGWAINGAITMTGDVSPRNVTRYRRGLALIGRGTSSGELQETHYGSVQYGDGSTATNFTGSATSTEGPYDTVLYEVDDDAISYRIYASASDTMDFRNQVLSSSVRSQFVIDPSSSTSATYLFDGLILRGFKATLKSGITFDGISFIKNAIIDAKGATLDGCSVTESNSTTSALTCISGGAVKNCEFTKGLETYAIELTTEGAYDFSGNTYSGYTNELNVTPISGAVTVTLAAGDTEPDYVTAGATVTFTQPTGSIDFSGVVAGSQIVVFNTGTQTEAYRNNNSSSTQSTGTLAGGVYDYTVMKAGYDQIRVVGVTVSGSPVSAPISQRQNRAYVASSGLTYGTTATLTGSTYAVTVATTVQNWYSFWVEAWIAESALTNKKFTIVPFGPNSFSLTDDTEFSSGSIQYLSRDGFRYVNTAGSVTAIYSAILSQGVTAGLQVEYEQVNGGAITDALSTGNIDQVLKVYGDASHGNFDYRNTLDIKVQENGYRQATTDVVETYGTLEEQLYVVSLPTVEIPNFTLGNPAISGVSIADHSSSPLSIDVGDGPLDYSLVITDTNNNSGEDILRWLNYNLSLDATFQGKNPFQFPEMVIRSGLNYETLTGILHLSGGDLTVGTIVLGISGDPHPDFSRFQSDSGAYGTPPVVATGSISGLVAGSRIRIYNQTTATELLNQIIAGTSYTTTYLNGVGYTDGDVVKVRVAYDDGTTHYDPQEYTAIVSESGWSISVDMQICSICTSWGIDGSIQTQYSLDGANIDIDISFGGAYSKKSIAAWWRYILMSEDGIRDFWGAFTLEALNSIRQEVSVVDILLQNLDAGTSVKFTDNDIRYYRSDFSLPYDDTAGYGSIFMDYSGVPLVVTSPIDIWNIDAVGQSWDTGSFGGLVKYLPQLVSRSKDL
jgi:hypothetical protein